MNNAPIKTYDDLVEERKRLEALLLIQRETVIGHWNAVKHELEPVNNAFGVIGKMTHGDKSNPLVNMGLKFAGDVLLKNFVLAKAGWLTRLAVPLVMKNYSSHLFAENGKGLLNKFRNILNGRHRTHHHEPLSQENTQFGRAEQAGEPTRL